MPKVKQTNPKLSPADAANYDLTAKITAGIREEWVRQRNQSGVSEVHYSRLSTVALTMVAAVVAVDVQMTREQFLAVAGANFDQALAQAPRFA